MDGDIVIPSRFALRYKRPVIYVEYRHGEHGKLRRRKMPVRALYSSSSPSSPSSPTTAAIVSGLIDRHRTYLENVDPAQLERLVEKLKEHYVEYNNDGDVVVKKAGGSVSEGNYVATTTTSTTSATMTKEAGPSSSSRIGAGAGTDGAIRDRILGSSKGKAGDEGGAATKENVAVDDRKVETRSEVSRDEENAADRIGPPLATASATAGTNRRNDERVVDVPEASRKAPIVIDGNTNLNEFDDETLAGVKRQMDETFEKNRVSPTSKDFVYDVVVDFAPPAKSSAWDEDENEDEDEDEDEGDEDDGKGRGSEANEEEEIEEDFETEEDAHAENAPPETNSLRQKTVEKDMASSAVEGKSIKEEDPAKTVAFGVGIGADPKKANVPDAQSEPPLAAPAVVRNQTQKSPELATVPSAATTVAVVANGSSAAAKQLEAENGKKAENISVVGFAKPTEVVAPSAPPPATIAAATTAAPPRSTLASLSSLPPVPTSSKLLSRIPQPVGSPSGTPSNAGSLFGKPIAEEKYNSKNDDRDDRDDDDDGLGSLGSLGVDDLFSDDDDDDAGGGAKVGGRKEDAVKAGKKKEDDDGGMMTLGGLAGKGGSGEDRKAKEGSGWGSSSPSVPPSISPPRAVASSWTSNAKFANASASDRDVSASAAKENDEKVTKLEDGEVAARSSASASAPVSSTSPPMRLDTNLEKRSEPIPPPPPPPPDNNDAHEIEEEDIVEEDFPEFDDDGDLDLSGGEERTGFNDDDDEDAFFDQILPKSTTKPATTSSSEPSTTTGTRTPPQAQPPQPFVKGPPPAPSSLDFKKLGAPATGLAGASATSGGFLKDLPPLGIDRTNGSGGGGRSSVVGRLGPL